MKSAIVLITIAVMLAMGFSLVSNVKAAIAKQQARSNMAQFLQ